jgi:hypothetical protein
MWTYSQLTGNMLDPSGKLVATGYSGAPGAVNDGNKEAIHDVGPIPQGQWKIGAGTNDPHLGPCAIRLAPMPGTNTFGRSDFLIHADRKDAATNPQAASHGCIIMPTAIRVVMAASRDRVLLVTS